jgi:hypothetical protein
MPRIRSDTSGIHWQCAAPLASPQFAALKPRAIVLVVMLDTGVETPALRSAWNDASLYLLCWLPFRGDPAPSSACWARTTADDPLGAAGANRSWLTALLLSALVLVRALIWSGTFVAAESGPTPNRVRGGRSCWAVLRRLRHRADAGPRGSPIFYDGTLGYPDLYDHALPGCWRSLGLVSGSVFVLLERFCWQAWSLRWFGPSRRSTRSPSSRRDRGPMRPTGGAIVHRVRGCWDAIRELVQASHADRRWRAGAKP